VDETGFNHFRRGYGSVYGGGNSRISLLEAAADVLYVFNMSATMARQGGQVQLEQSNTRLALNMAKMAKEGFSRAAIVESKYLIRKPRAKVRKAKKWAVEFPGHKKVKASIQRHSAILRQNQISSCLPCQNGTPENLETSWRCKGTGAPPPAQRREQIPEPTAPPPGTPPAPTSNTSGTKPAEIVNLPAGYKYSHTGLPFVEFSEDDEDTEHDTDFAPEMLTDQG
jgi:hypothetical protein